MSASFEYGVAIDACLLGLQIFLYQWRGSRGLLSLSSGGMPFFAMVEREAVFSKEQMPGIGRRSQDDDEGKVSFIIGIEELRMLVEPAKLALPPGVDLSAVPIFLGAAARILLLIVVVAAPSPTFPPIIFLATMTIVTKGDTMVLFGGARAAGTSRHPPTTGAPPSHPPALPRGIALSGVLACLVGSVRRAEGSGGYQQGAS
jgi:hypothetical protein